MLSKRTIRNLTTQIALQENNLHFYLASPHLYHLEARYTLFALGRLLANSNNPDLETDLIKFFKRRWERIHNLDIQYLHDFTNPANTACILIAIKLGETQNIPYMTILMPTLLQVAASEYFTSSYQENLNLKELILSDNNQRIIHIPDALDGSQEDGRLKHNSLFAGKVTTLSFQEKNKLLSRHDSIKKMHDALQDRVNFKLFGNTVGANVNRLIYGLREGGTHAQGPGRGQEYDAGYNANEAIVSFSDYLKTLDEEILDQLMAAGTFDRFDAGDEDGKWECIQDLWERLSDPIRVQDATSLPASYCVNLIANHLEDILEENPGLYELISYEGDALGNLAQLNEAVNQTKKNMEEHLPLLTTHPFYGSANDDKCCLQLLQEIAVDHSFPIKADDLVFFLNKYATAAQEQNRALADLAPLCAKLITAQYHSAIINTALKKMSAENLQQFKQLTQPLQQAPINQNTVNLTFFKKPKKRKRTLDEDNNNQLCIPSKRQRDNSHP